MRRLLRILGYVVCWVQLTLGLAFVFEWQPIIELWPFSSDPGYSSNGADDLSPTTTAPLPNYSFAVLGSIYIAAAASTFWALISRENFAFAGIALDYILIFLPVGIYAFQIAGNNSALTLFGLISAIMVAIGVIMFLWGVRQPIHAKQPTPRLVRYAFAFFVIALIIVGGAMMLKQPNILPWSVSPTIAVIYGWMFLGAAGYFAFGVIRPFWRANAAGQLAGFLAYDIVLVVPFLQYLSRVPAQWRLNLIIYLLVIVSSAILALYYLFIHPPTRVIHRAPIPAQTA